MPDKGRFLYKGFTAVSAGAASTSVVCRPAEGQVWWAYLLQAYHTAGGNRLANWGWVDELVSGITFSPDIAALAPSAIVPFGAYNSGVASYATLPIRITYTSYPVFIWVATGAAENGFIRALVSERMGIVER
jgi:hypothetical protein